MRSRLTIYPAQLAGCFMAPPSKSMAHRVMIGAGLTKGETIIHGYETSGDMEATKLCLEQLGVHFELSGKDMLIRGTTEHQHHLPLMNCMDSGSTLRFFVPIAMARSGGGVFHMSGQLASRPMNVYQSLFVPRGVHWHMRPGADGGADLVVQGDIHPGEFKLPGNVSSQFISGLLFALPILRGDSFLYVDEPLESKGYVNMTLKALDWCSIKVDPMEKLGWHIPGRQSYRAKDIALDGDYTQAAVFLCAGALGFDITAQGLPETTLQDDYALLAMLEKLGARVKKTNGDIRVHGGNLKGVRLDASNNPDIAPLLALLCQLAEGESRISGVSRLKLKECDRLSATVEMLNALGGNITLDKDEMVIQGQESLAGGVFVNTHGDHRMAMLAALAATRCKNPIEIENPACVGKSWPNFFRVYESLGGKFKQVQ